MAEAGMVVAGRYRLLEPVGEGSMGWMWRAYDLLLERVVAVQEVMLPQSDGWAGETALRRVMIEVRAAAHLQHPNVAALHDFFEYGGEPWLVMKFIPGQSLMAEIADNGRLPWGRVAEIGARVADALAYAHTQGIVHRNLNPGSILVSGTEAIVTGFGVAQLFVVRNLTGAGSAVEYTPPEVLKGVVAGTPGDLWALGAILYTAVEGRPPFSGLNVRTEIVNLPPAAPKHAGPLSGLLKALLTKDPAERPDAKAVVLALTSHPAGPADLQQVSGGWVEPSRQSSSGPFTININQQIFSKVDGNAVQNVGGTVSFGPRTEELLNIISRYGGTQAPALKEAVYEIEDQSAAPEVRRAARNKLMTFLRQLGKGAQQVTVDVFEKYIEAKLGL
jgi:serine/threonine protein kinase